MFRRIWKRTEPKGISAPSGRGAMEACGARDRGDLARWQAFLACNPVWHMKVVLPGDAPEAPTSVLVQSKSRPMVGDTLALVDFSGPRDPTRAPRPDVTAGVDWPVVRLEDSEASKSLLGAIAQKRFYRVVAVSTP